jgi:hypothetical protein
MSIPNSLLVKLRPCFVEEKNEIEKSCRSGSFANLSTSRKYDENKTKIH